LEVIATQLDHVVEVQVLAWDDLLRVSKLLVLLVKLAEFPCSALVAPKRLRGGVHHAVLVINLHTKPAIRWNCINDKRPWRLGDHFFIDLDVRAQRIPSRGVIQDLFVVALDVQVIGGPALVTDTMHFKRPFRSLGLVQVNQRSIHRHPPFT
ncbi:MAG: hypothetical protein ACK55Z_00835, partial [bacterium]